MLYSTILVLLDYIFQVGCIQVHHTTSDSTAFTSTTLDTTLSYSGLPQGPCSIFLWAGFEIWTLSFSLPKASMHLYGTCLGLKWVPISLAYGLLVYHMGTWSHWDGTDWVLTDYRLKVRTRGPIAWALGI